MTVEILCSKSQDKINMNSLHVAGCPDHFSKDCEEWQVGCWKQKRTVKEETLISDKVYDSPCSYNGWSLVSV